MDTVGPVQKLAIIAETISPDCEFAMICARVAQQVDETFSADYPSVEDVLTELMVYQGGVRTELPNTMFAMTSPAIPIELDGLIFVPIALHGREAKTTLLACVGRNEDRVHLAFEYRPAVLEAQIASQMLDNYAALILSLIHI